MVSVKQLEGEHPYVKSNAGSEQSKCHLMSPRGIKTHLYWFGSTTPSNSASSEEGQSLLDALLLSQWETRSWNGQFKYDVTMCETKILSGGLKMIAQLNEKWNSNFLTEFENTTLLPSGPFKPSSAKILRENLMFCIANGLNESAELVPSATLPKSGALIVVNVNPVEYGHIFLVPYDICQSSQFLDKKVLYLVHQFAAEINSSAFRVFFEPNVSPHVYFQGGYFANPLPVELQPSVTLYDSGDKGGVSIHELAGYPMKALLFTSHNLESLVELVAEICSYLLPDENVLFNLLVSDYGTKVFLFPQIPLPASGSPLSTWECSGYFVFNNSSEFDGASEAELSKRLASASIDDNGFQALKKLCCGIATKLH